MSRERATTAQNGDRRESGDSSGKIIQGSVTIKALIVTDSRPVITTVPTPRAALAKRGSVTSLPPASDYAVDGSIPDIVVLPLTPLGRAKVEQLYPAVMQVAEMDAAPDETPSGPLTSREWEVVELLAQGLSNKQISRLLQIEIPTVKNHVHHILSKLEVSRPGEAAAWLMLRRHNGRATQETKVESRQDARV